MVKFQQGQRVNVTRKDDPGSLGWPSDHLITGVFGDNLSGEVVSGPYQFRDRPVWRVAVDGSVGCNNGKLHWWCHEHWIESESGPW